MKQDQWVLEWSKHSNNFHVQHLHESLAWAQMCFLENKQNLWSIIMVGSREVVDSMADSSRSKLRDRSIPKIFADAI
jgi:hypothetical protein